MKTVIPAILALEDGAIFHGAAVGYWGEATGEVVFNTAMTGYQEILTDPSYAQQIITFTYPHIGNTGTTPEDAESDTVWAAGLILRDLPKQTSNWRSTQVLSDYLRERKIVAIAGIDTRALTHLLRDKGALRGHIVAGLPDGSREIDVADAVAKAKAWSGLENLDLAKVVSTKKSYTWHEGSDWDAVPVPKKASNYNVVVYDYGVKRNILRLLVNHGCTLTVVPAQTPAEDVIALNPDGVFLSNGPGDPAACDYAIEAIKVLLDKGIPLFGICLGYQLLALACGAKTYKMKFGHHGANHPVQATTSTQRVMISSQNHGFAVDETTLPNTLEATHHALFDGTLQGIQHTVKPAFSFQGHPEGNPGPHDLTHLFEHFIKLMMKSQCQNAATLKVS